MRVYFPYIFVLRFLNCVLRKKLFFGTAAATEAKDLDQRLREVKAARQLPGQPLEIDEVTFDVLHRLAAGADEVMMRLEVAVHTQC